MHLLIGHIIEYIRHILSGWHFMFAVSFGGENTCCLSKLASLDSKKIAQKLSYELSYRCGGTADNLISSFNHVSSLSSLAISCKKLLAIMSTTILDSLKNIRSSEESPHA